VQLIVIKYRIFFYQMTVWVNNNTDRTQFECLSWVHTALFSKSGHCSFHTKQLSGVAFSCCWCFHTAWVRETGVLAQDWNCY